MEHDEYELFTEKLSKNHASYVLITCDRPTADGEMSVNMSHEGDSMLVSYLIQTAQGMIEGQVDQEIAEASSNLRVVK